MMVDGVGELGGYSRHPEGKWDQSQSRSEGRQALCARGPERDPCGCEERPLYEGPE